MGAGGLPVARILGIEIRISMAWVVLVALIAVVGAQQASLSDANLNPVVQLGIGIVVALLFLATVITHELTHALVGRRRGVPATAIVLGFIGGLAPLSIQAESARDELVIAFAGPIVSFAMGAVLAVAGVLLGSILPASAPIAGGIVVVGVLNLILAILSLLPAMPLDGGRVVRALAWARTGDRDRAYRTTARVGRMVGWTILGAGVALILADLVTEGLIGIALGWLLNTGARTGERRLALQQLLRGARVSDAMRVDVPFVGPNLTIDTFANRFEGQDAVAAMPVVDDDRVVGVLGRKRLIRLGKRRFGGTRVDEVMAAPPQAPVLAPSDALWDAVEAMNEAGLDGLAVADDGRLAGLITRESLGDAIRSLAAAQAARSA
ncbi:MAG TPA: CBS domain-containing protein [Candidatus Limnocylindrales bacterium]